MECAVMIHKVLLQLMTKLNNYASKTSTLVVIIMMLSSYS